MCSTDEIMIDFENIQSIKKGKITIKEKGINIKYGYNGIGKSSIAKAIDYKINNKIDEFNSLSPYLGGIPNVKVSKGLSKCKSFNSSYIDSFLFKGDRNVINESFSIFFKNDELANKEKDINDLLSNLNDVLNDQNIIEFINKYNNIEQNFKINKDGKILSGSCAIVKGFKNQPLVNEKIEEYKLESYKGHIDSYFSPRWLKWFKEGTNYIVGNECPYCMKILDNDFGNIKNNITNLTSESILKNILTAKNVVLSLASIVDINKQDEIKKINNTKSELNENDQQKLINYFNEVTKEVNKIYELKNQKKVYVDSVDKISLLENFKNYKLNLDYFKSLGDANIYEAVKKVNGAIDVIISKIDELTIALKKYNEDIVETTKVANTEINNFLKYAGIPYKFEIRLTSNNVSETVITPVVDANKSINNARDCLSYGEFNAFCLALFGATAKRENADLIILDDPISSFDENKKFAINHFLFNAKDGMLKDKTVLMLTHDMEPLLDMVRVNFVGEGDKSYKKRINANLIINNKNIISEKKINSGDIKNSIQQELKSAKNIELDQYIRVIHLRRYFELSTTTKDSYEYNVVSNAEHLRKNCIKYENGKQIDMPIGEFEKGINIVKRVINDFDYDKFVDYYNDDENLLNLYNSANDNYDKIIYIRPLLEHNKKNIDKKLENFITENFHVENMFLYTICKDKQIPNYIISLCDELVNEIVASKKYTFN